VIIDSHQHFWKYNSKRDAWITDDMSVIQRDFLPEHLGPILTKNSIDGCVAIQADQSETEMDFLVSLAEKHTFIKGVVGWVDLKSTSVETRIEHFSNSKWIKGVRHIVQAEPEGFLLKEDFLHGVSHLDKQNLTYDLLIFPHQLREAISFVGKFPDLPIVLDHIAKPYIKSGKIDQWKQDISELSQARNLYCKVSGIVTEADWNHWMYNDLRPYLDVVFEVFETDRLMFGSDWPVCLMAGNYSEIQDIILNYIAEYSEQDQNKIMGQNAFDFYNL